MSGRLLIIDCQVMQTNAWDRGMGKYSLSLLKALGKAKSLPPGTTLMLNKNLPAEASMLKELKAACPGAELIYLDLAVPSARRTNDELDTINRAAIDAYIGGLPADQDIDFLIMSLFLNQAFVVFPARARKLLLFYDLIPFIFESRYAERINYDDYLFRFRSIFAADLIYTISQTVADDLMIYLGISKDKLHNINGASISRAHLPSEKPDFDVPEKYILLNSGDELRKNNLNAVRGFAEFNEQHDNAFTMIVTSSFGEKTQQEMGIYSNHLLFSGNIPEAQLEWLYKNAELIMCPSEYEGLGLPVLEAMSSGKKIVCSNIPVFQEISDEAFYFFEPEDPSSIAGALNEALDGERWKSRRASYDKVLGVYTWDKTAKAYREGYEAAFKETLPVTGAKPKVAIFTPPPSGYSGVGKLVAELHASLDQYFDIDYYYDYQKKTDKHVRPDYVKHVANCFDARDFNASTYKQYQFVIYHLGNSDYHLNTIKNALYLPGFVIMHDTHLQGAFGELRRLGWISPQRLELEERLNAKSGSRHGSFLTSILSNQLGIITHSEYALQAAREAAGPDVKAVRAELPAGAPKLLRPKAQDGYLHVGLAGILADVKGLPLIESLAGDPSFSRCLFHIFGFSFIRPETLDRLYSFSNVRVHLDPTDFEFQTHLSKLDALINYRLEYRGETSLTTLEAMRYGTVPLVRSDGWYGELPSDAVIHVSDERELSSALWQMQTKAAPRRMMARKAWQYVGEHHSHEQYAAALSTLTAEVIEAAANPNLEKAHLLLQAKNRRQLRRQ